MKFDNTFLWNSCRLIRVFQFHLYPLVLNTVLQRRVNYHGYYNKECSHFTHFSFTHFSAYDRTRDRMASSHSGAD